MSQPEDQNPPKRRSGLRLRPALPDADGAPGTRRPIGPRLAAARIALDEALPDVARSLKIREPHLRAIEEGDFDALPGPTYASGFIRTYAAHVGLDPDEIVDHFRQEVADSHRTELSFPVPVMEGRIPSGALIFVSVLAAVIVYFGWYFLSSGSRPSEGMIEPVPAELAAVLDHPADSGTAPGAVEQAAPEPAPVPEPGTTPAETAATADRRPPPAASAAAAPSPSPTPVTAPAPAPGAQPADVVSAAVASARVVLRASADSWVEVKDGDGNVLISRLMRPGDVYAVPKRPGVALATGNAGGLAVLVDGRPLAPLGPVGAVRRDISLEPETAGKSIAPKDAPPPARDAGPSAGTASDAAAPETPTQE